MKTLHFSGTLICCAEIDSKHSFFPIRNSFYQLISSNLIKCVYVICSTWKSQSFHSILYLVKCLFSLSHSSTFQMLNVSSLRDFKRLIKMRVVIALTFHNLTHRHQWASLNVEKQCLVYRFLLPENIEREERMKSIIFTQTKFTITIHYMYSMLRKSQKQTFLLLEHLHNAKFVVFSSLSHFFQQQNEKLSHKWRKSKEISMLNVTKFYAIWPSVSFKATISFFAHL